MNLQLQNFSTLVNNAAAAVQGAASELLDLTVGSTLRAILEANASVVLWLQWLIIQVLQTTRAATSSGNDLDSWMADFTVTRLPAVAAFGYVTFARFTPVTAALVPVATLVKTADGTQAFTVATDTGNGAFSASQNGYVLLSGISSVTVPVVAVVPGSAGNVSEGAVTLINAALPGVDTVNNTGAFQGGLNAETDAELRTRFQGFIASRSQATPLALGYALSSIQQGVQYNILENLAADGTERLGNFVAIVDDGSGSPPSSLVAAAGTALEAVRPVGSTFSVLPPTIVDANVSMTITTAGSAVHSDIVAKVGAALTTYIDGLPLAASLPWTKLVQLSYDAAPTITNVATVLLNGGTADLTVTNFQVIKASSIVVS